MPLFALALAVAAPGALLAGDTLKAECERAAKLHTLLVLAAMNEGPMDCGDGSGHPMPCDANDTPEQKQAQARRWEIRKYQAAGYQAAANACTEWRADSQSPARRDAALAAIAEARSRDKGTPPPPQN